VFSLFWPEQAQSTVAWTKLQATWIRQHPAKTPIEPFRFVDFDAINYIHELHPLNRRKRVNWRASAFVITCRRVITPPPAAPAIRCSPSRGSTPSGGHS